MCIASPTIAPTGMRGSSEANGSWKTIWMSRRSARSLCGGMVVSSTPSNSIDPDVAGSSCRMTRPVVDLPDPDSPTIPRVSLRRSSKLTPSTARFTPTGLRTRPPLSTGKCFVRSRTRSTTSPGGSAGRAPPVSNSSPEPSPLRLDLGGEVARRRVLAARGGDQRRLLDVAAVAPDRAARRERAARGEPDELRRPPGDRRERLARAGVDPRQRAEQADRVRHARPVVEVVDVPDLDRPPGVHHQHPVGDAGDHAEVVGDQHHRRAGLAVGRLQRLEHLGLDGHVERGGRLVGDDHVRPVGHRHRDHHALAHPARELVRVLVEPPRRVGDPEQPEQLAGPLPAGRPGRRPVVRPDRLGELGADPGDRVQRGHRVLQDHRQVAAPHPAELAVAQPEQLLPVQPHRALHHGRARQQAHDRQRGHGLAAAGLADDPEHLAPAQRERQAPDRVHHPVLGRAGRTSRSSTSSTGGVGRPAVALRSAWCRGPVSR